MKPIDMGKHIHDMIWDIPYYNSICGVELFKNLHGNCKNSDRGLDNFLNLTCGIADPPSTMIQGPLGCTYRPHSTEEVTHASQLHFVSFTMSSFIFLYPVGIQSGGS